jgi:hypothetical protein
MNTTHSGVPYCALEKQLIRWGYVVVDMGEKVAYSNLKLIGEVVGDLPASPPEVRPGVVSVFC